ncbi:MAG TPA: TIR domain-containing protein [Lacunisphaera sp.]|nr:TIR domain-containing protein [Lacunisphaera sp.]
MSDSGKAVFLSYASQDAEAAKKICEALRAAGVEVWFDQSELVGGDAWDAKIRRQIKECALLIPIISQNTQARHEGYFRLEWRLADQRTHLMGRLKAFLLPVSIDGTSDADADVPDSFVAVQWTKAPGGEVPPAFCARVRKLLDGESSLEAGRPRPATTRGEGTPPPPRKSRRLRPALAFAVLAAIALAVTWKMKSGDAARPPAVKQEASAGTTAGEPAAPEAVTHAWALVNKLDVSRVELDVAEQMLAQEAKLHPNSAGVAAAWALIDTRYLNEYYDVSNTRRESARRHAAEASSLDPDNPRVRLARAATMHTLSWDSATVAEATRILQSVREALPDEPQIYAQLGWMAPTIHEAEEWWARQARLPGQAATAAFNLALRRASIGDFRGGYASLNESLASEKSIKGLLWKAYLQVVWLGDLAAAQHTMAEVPADVLVEDMPASARGFVAFWARDYQQALAAAQAVPRDFMESAAGRMPTGYFRGMALSLLGRPLAAESEWKAALAATEQRLQTDRNDHSLLLAKALLLVELHDLPAAEQTRRMVLELYGDSVGEWAQDYLDARLLPPGEAIARLEEFVHGRKGGAWVTAAVLRLNPYYDRFRNDPRFVALLAEAEADPRLSPTAPAVPSPDPGNAPASQSGQASSPPDKSVAVLAFANLSDDKENEYFSDGISEELLNVLAKVPGLKVTARTSSFYFKGKDVPVPEIAQKLGVAYVVEGSVRKQGDRVRITAQLIKAADGFHLWSDTFTRELKDIFAVQDEIAGLIAQNLKLKMGEPREARTVNPEAYRLVLEGRQFWNLRTDEGFSKAEAAFAKAVAIDPDFAQAHAGLAGVYIIRAVYQELDSQPVSPEDLRRAGVEGHRALEIDPKQAEALAALGYVEMFANRLGPADKYFQQALALSPNSALVHCWYALLLAGEGRLDDALVHYQKTAELDPLWFINLKMYAEALEFARRYDEALSVTDRAAALRTDVFLPNLGTRASNLLALGRKDEALEAARHILARPDEHPRWIADATALHVLWAGGRKDEAEEKLQALFARLPADSYQRGFALVAVGRFADAEPLLTHVPSAVARSIYWGPMWDPWRETPAFHALIARIDRVAEYKVARETLARMRKGTEANR